MQPRARARIVSRCSGRSLPEPSGRAAPSYHPAVTLEDVTIRSATPADAAALAVSRYRFRTTIDGSQRATADAGFEAEAAFVARATPLIESFLRGGCWHAWIAECGGRLCGHLIDKMPNPDPGEPERLGYLTSFFVEPDLRERGVGAALMQELEAFAQRSDVEKILIVGTTVRSRSLYARRGYGSASDLLQKTLR
jgi:GNAT superfamily N-acetyltransferase